MVARGDEAVTMRSYYSGSITQFLRSSPETVLNALEDGHAGEGFGRTPEQRIAWCSQVEILQASLLSICQNDAMQAGWGLLLEYSIPGRHKRLDAVLLTPRGIIVLEFKAGKAAAVSGDKWQVLEYCWNLRDFHRASLGWTIAPILVPTEMESEPELPCLEPCDTRRRILTMQIVGASQLAQAIIHAFTNMPYPEAAMPSLAAWEASLISPSQDIIEATRQQFGKHTVSEIEHSHADNADQVVARVADIVRFSQEKKRRSICFVTGVPGAGKTLVGLRVAYQSEATALANSAPCFASGNTKLLAVLGAALGLNLAKSKADVRQTVHDLTAPLWDVHKFARLHLADKTGSPPSFRVVVFDEAQRVWTAEKVEKAMRAQSRRGRRAAELPEEFWTNSEPEMLLRVMEQFSDWCVVVALVGGGQEIHDGEAGLRAWGSVLQQRMNEWDVWVSPEALAGGTSVAGQTLFAESPASDKVHADDLLHLSVTRRSYRAVRLNEWVNAVLEGRPDEACAIAHSLSEFRVEMTRDLATARKRLREFTQEDQRIGLLASSGAKRLRAEGVEVHKALRDAVNWPKWFLADRDDVDCSSQLEIAASEFECQGLELDHTCVCWGTDLSYVPGHGWRFRSSRGQKLKEINKHAQAPFIVNKYRVLLTRAREGMVIFVPRGDLHDVTRRPLELDGTAEFLRACGIPEA
jgi:DUF2075 family protein